MRIGLLLLVLMPCCAQAPRPLRITRTLPLARVREIVEFIESRSLEDEKLGTVLKAMLDQATDITITIRTSRRQQ